MLKLQSREIPLVTFRRVLPDFLGPKGEECFIEVDARAGGAMNTAFGAAVESLLLRARVMDRKVEKIADDEKFVTANHANSQAVARDRLGAMYDTCVIEWRSNIQVLDKDDKPVPITCDRASFVDLAFQRIPELVKAFRELEAEIHEAGQIIAEEDADTEKN